MNAIFFSFKCPKLSTNFWKNIVFIQGDVENGRFKKNIASDVIFSERRGQS